MANEPMDRVVPMNQLPGWKVVDGEPDIRGWDVMASDGRRLGRVDDLLVDTQANKVRYVDVDGDERHMTIPIGYARLEEERRQVLVERLGDDQLQALPAYDHGPITRDYEEQVGRACNLSTSPAMPDFYEGEAFRGNNEMRLTLNEEQLEVGKRQVSAGEVGVHKHVETERVREEVPLRHEEVVVERRPITDPMAAGRGEIIETDDEIRIPLMAEEAVVEKRVVPKEELVVRKREVVETESVDTTLRSEHAEVDREVTNTEVRGDRLDNDRLDRR
ncbi:MAG TPA: DUF2382 domain-containing protein [Longimicrobiaceae bacterium]|nr:DUF2382 domain-containing protein [Longimicrobiaceae bacterium]